MIKVIEEKMKELEERIKVNKDLLSKLQDEELKFKYELEIEIDTCSLDTLKHVIREIGVHLVLSEIHKDIKELFKC